jgi:hypothetical protein
MNERIRQKIGGDSAKDNAGQNNELYHLEAGFQKPGYQQKETVEDHKIER